MRSPLLLFALLASGASAQTMKLDVDATQAPMKILHARLEIPAKPGDLTLSYAKWIPGEHMPSGPISNLVNLHLSANGQELDWRRDLVDMNSFHLVVPEGADAVIATYDYAIPTQGGAFGAAISADAQCTVLNWYTVDLAPADADPEKLMVKTTLTVPEGWKNGGSLDMEGRTGDTISYAAVSLSSLNDHPVVFGAHFRHIELWPAGSPNGEHAIDVIADSDWALDFPKKRIDAYRKLVSEERAVFGGVGHYRKYHWLLTLSDQLGVFGVEHHECADDRVAENSFVDDDASRRDAILLPHEFFHSWNGKTRRPIGLTTGGYAKPMQDDLLWVYEGLTNYYGEVLAARCGLISAEDLREIWASDAYIVSGPGRTWRPLQDTADSAPYLYNAGGGWNSLRRSTDFYAEGSLIWLEADVTIRRLTGGAKSLDDFCTLFHGEGDNGRVYVKPYTFEDVCAALNKVAEYDWKGFFTQRLRAKGPDLPLGGVTAGGFRFEYNDHANFFTQGLGGHPGLDASASLGLVVTPDGNVQDCQVGSPAYAAGISNGMNLVALNGRKFSIEDLTRAIASTSSAEKTLEFIIDNSGYYKTVRVSYKGGIKNPHLVRDEKTADLLTEIAKPKTKD